MVMLQNQRYAVSYWRYSSNKQEGGDSTDRQARDFATFVEAHNLKPWGKPYGDEGLSGYTGEHHSKGDLGRLITDAGAGRFPPGTVVVVEAWDRLGRLRPDEQTALVAELLRTGVSIGICRLNDIFTEADLGGHKWTIFSTFAMLAYQESKQKSDRVADAWKQKRRRAATERTVETSLVPAWVEIVGDRRKVGNHVVGGTFRLIPDKADTVRLIFKLAASGYSLKDIVNRFIAELVPPFSG
jgi:DNA invertase Pin-like site-specific DNA recombinase